MDGIWRLMDGMWERRMKLRFLAGVVWWMDGGIVHCKGGALAKQMRRVTRLLSIAWEPSRRKCPERS